MYLITIETDPEHVSCSCTGCATHGYCKHIKTYKHVIRQILDEKPGV